MTDKSVRRSSEETTRLGRRVEDLQDSTSQTLVAIQLGLARLRNAAVADNQPTLDQIGSLIAEIREHIRAATRE